MNSGPDVSRIYVDANVFIYAVEGEPVLAHLIQRLFEALRARSGMAVTSEFTLAEVLAKASTVQQRKYLSLIVWSGIFDLCTVSREVLIETAAYRRTVGASKLADAIHVVSAIRHGCDTIISADLRLKVPEDISLINPSTDCLSHLVEMLS